MPSHGNDPMRQRVQDWTKGMTDGLECVLELILASPEDRSARELANEIAMTLAVIRREKEEAERGR